MHVLCYAHGTTRCTWCDTPTFKVGCWLGFKEAHHQVAHKHEGLGDQDGDDDEQQHDKRYRQQDLTSTEMSASGQKGSHGPV